MQRYDNVMCRENYALVFYGIYELKEIEWFISNRLARVGRWEFKTHFWDWVHCLALHLILQNEMSDSDGVSHGSSQIGFLWLPVNLRD